MIFGLFRVKTVISDQNWVHRGNTGQIMSTRVKNEFRAVSGQNHHFPTKTEFTGSIRVKPCWPGEKMSFGLFQVKTVIFDQNQVHRVNTGQTMSTRVKNDFRAVTGQKPSFLTNTRFTGLIPIKCFFGIPFLFFFFLLKQTFSNTDLNF